MRTETKNNEKIKTVVQRCLWLVLLMTVRWPSWTKALPFITLLTTALSH